MSSESAARPQATPGAALLPSPGIFSAPLHGSTFPGPRVPSNTGDASALLFHNDEYHPISALAPTLEPVPSPFAPAHRSAPYRVPRPPNAFMLFRSSCCKENARGKMQPRANLNTWIPAQWKALSPEQREQWEAHAQEKKKEHEAQHPGYKYQPQRKEKDGTSAAAAHRRSRPALQRDGGASVSRPPPRHASHLPNVAVLRTFDPPSAPTTSPLARAAAEVLSPASNGSQVWASPSLPPRANNPAPLLNMRPLSIPVYRPSGPAYAPSPLSPSFDRVPFPNTQHSSTPVHGPSTPYTPFSASSFSGTPSLGTSPSSISGSLPSSPYTPAPSFRLLPPYLASPCSTAPPGDRVAYPNYGLGLGCEPPFDMEAGYSPAQADFIAATSPAQYSYSTPTPTWLHHEAMQPATLSSGAFSHGGDGPMHTYPPSDRDAAPACPACGPGFEPPFASAATEGLQAGYSPAPLPAPPQPAQANFVAATSHAQYSHSMPAPMPPAIPPSVMFSHGRDSHMPAYPHGAFAAAPYAGAYYAHRGRGHALAGDPRANYPRTPPAHGWDRTRTGPLPRGHALAGDPGANYPQTPPAHGWDRTRTGPLPRAPQASYFPGAASTSRASRRPGDRSGAHERF